MVPFGYERKEYEKQIKDLAAEPLYKRVYLNLIAGSTPEGKLVPQVFELNNKKYKIDQILDIQDGKSFKHRNNSIRFYCKCGRKKFYLFFEDCGFGHQRFYLELKDGYRLE
ncbi:MAG: hypothetical protein K0R50_4356 [Eubacterium sp.]|jgi:hypothetical protein|nr:hypothetical protein [Eubacterium sp.]